MTSPEMIVVVVASAVVSCAYLVPTAVGIVRLRGGVARIVVLNLLLGWTGVGWIWALRLACAHHPEAAGAPASRVNAHPEAVMRAPRADIYVDGTYLIAEAGAASTWAVCKEGRWGIVYELDGRQRVGIWVDSTDVPVEVLARALAATPGARR